MSTVNIFFSSETPGEVISAHVTRDREIALVRAHTESCRVLFVGARSAELAELGADSEFGQRTAQLWSSWQRSSAAEQRHYSRLNGLS